MQSNSTSAGAPQSTTESYITTTITGGQPPPGCEFAATVTSHPENVTFNVYMSPDPKVGDSVCLYATVNGAGTAHVGFMEFTVTNSTGTVFFQLNDSLGAGCCLGSVSAFWNTYQSYQGLTPRLGAYRLYVTPHGFDARTEAPGFYNDTAIDFSLS